MMDERKIFFFFFYLFYVWVNDRWLDFHIRLNILSIMISFIIASTENPASYKYIVEKKII